jgi:alkane 1-monooxygenase
MTAWAPLESSTTAETETDHMRRWWVMAAISPLLGVASFGLHMATGWTGWLFFIPVFVFVLAPIGDVILGLDRTNRSAEATARLAHAPYYMRLCKVFIGLQLYAFLAAIWYIETQDDSLFVQVMLVISMGILNGIAISPAHYIGHKSEQPQWLGRLSFAQTLYGHFFIQHNRGHHRDVATYEDHGSSRYGESFYAFWPRAVFGGVARSWQLEADRLRRRGMPVLHWKNENLWAWSMSLGLFAYAVAYAGWDILPFVIAQAVLGFSLLEVVMYLSHYGLGRRRLPSGRYEKVTPQHSWNSNYIVSNLFLFNLQRHSDHHINPASSYQILRNEDEAPNLPGGYPLMILLALVPPLWFRAMNPRVEAYYEGDLLGRANLTRRARTKLEQAAAPGGANGDNSHPDRVVDAESTPR